MSTENQGILKNAIVKDVLICLLFGILSALLGMVQFQTPGFDGSYSDLREIALLICLVHLRNPAFTLLLSLITLLWLPEDAPYLPTYVMHAIPLYITWYARQWIEQKKWGNVITGIAWFVTVIIYYVFLLYPILIISYQVMGINPEQNFGEAYASLFISWKFEIVATALVTSLYFVQYEIRKSLELTNKNLENIVSQRTKELSKANHELQSLNEELLASNEEVKTINENLERLIHERTNTIRDQLLQLSKYAHMNSHEVRAPLARMLGLLALIKKETNSQEKEDMLDKLYDCSKELDEIIKKMNRLLDQEIHNNQSD
jgi:signal transduction histidine kinase